VNKQLSPANGSRHKNWVAIQFVAHHFEVTIAANVSLIGQTIAGYRFLEGSATLRASLHPREFNAPRRYPLT
jgi:hypothetical protein